VVGLTLALLAAFAAAALRVGAARHDGASSAGPAGATGTGAATGARREEFEPTKTAQQPQIESVEAPWQWK